MGVQPVHCSPIWKTVTFFAVTAGLLYALWGPY